MAEPRLPQSVIDDRAKLAAMEAPYLRAKEYIKSEQYKGDLEGMVRKIRRVMPRGNECSADKALLAIGGIMQILDEFGDKTAIIVAYESLLESVRRATAGIDL